MLGQKWLFFVVFVVFLLCLTAVLCCIATATKRWKLSKQSQVVNIQTDAAAPVATVIDDDDGDNDDDDASSSQKPLQQLGLIPLISVAFIVCT